MRTITGISFKIGTADGEYPMGTSITDSIFETMERAGASISSMVYSNQGYAEGWTIVGRKLFLPSTFSTFNNSTLFVNFDQAIRIS